MGFSGQVEAVRKATAPAAAPMTMAEVVLTKNPDYPHLPPTFRCRGLRATITPKHCASNHSRADIASVCFGCEVGRAHAHAVEAPQAPITKPGEFVLLTQATPTQSCVRCGRDGRDEHSQKIIGRFRTVQRTTVYLPKSSGKTSVCVSCFNRQCEVRDGRNSKGAKPVRNACLRDTTITYSYEGETFADVPIGLRSSVNECRRLLDRAYGKAAKLKAVCFDGNAADLRDRCDPLLAANRAPAQKRASAPTRTPKPFPIASDADAAITEDDLRITWRRVAASPTPRVDWDDWDTPLYKLGKPAPSDASTADGNGTARRFGWLPPLSEDEDAAYRASFDQEETLADSGFPSSLADFVAWLSAEWPQSERSPIVVKPTIARPAPRYFDKSAEEWAKVWGVTPEVAAERLKDQLDDAAALQVVRDPVVRPPMQDEPEPDPLDVLDAESGMQYAPVEPSEAVAEPEALPKVAQPVQKPARAPEPVKYDMKTRAGRRAFEKAALKEQKQIQREQKVQQSYPSIANTARAFVQVLFEQCKRS